MWTWGDAAMSALSDLMYPKSRWVHYSQCPERGDGRVTPCSNCVYIEVGIEMAQRVIVDKMDSVKIHGTVWTSLNDALVRITDVRTRK